MHRPIRHGSGRSVGRCPARSFPWCQGLGLLFALAPACLSAQSDDSADFLSRARAALGAEAARLEVRGEGWEACLGQPWNVNEGWARWELRDYRRVIDYGSGESLQTASRRAGLDPERLGGCGAQPNAEPAPQQSAISADSPWAQQLALWLTPQGVLELYEQGHGGSLQREGEGWLITFSLQRDGVEHSFEASYDAAFLPTRVYTEVDDPLYGNLPVEALFSDYRDFGGVRFPAHLELKQGGHATLSLDVASVLPDSDAPAAPSPRPAVDGGRAGPGATPPSEPFSAIAEGVFVLNGAYQGVAVEFDDFLVLIDGLQNDARARELIQQAKAAVPGKPIRYVVSTHFHNDHANGLREFVAEGAVVLIHEISAAALREALERPRSLRAEPNPAEGLPVQVEGVDDVHVIEDARGQRLELHRLRGSAHADDMLIAWLPRSGVVVEADLLQPWIMPQFGGGFADGHPFLHQLADELERLGLDYDRFVPVHRPTPAPTMSRQQLLEAIGRAP